MEPSSPNSQPLRIVFAGTPEFAAEHLLALLSSQHRVIGVYTQPDRPAGRGKKYVPGPVKTLAEEHRVSVFQPFTLKDPADQQSLAELQPDLMVVVAYGLILPPAVLAIPRLGCINVHASLLPRWRGAAPIQRAIEAGDEVSGITIMEMEEGLDTGPMLAMAECPITQHETGGSLHDKLALIGPGLLLETIEHLAQGVTVPRVQDHIQATYAPKLSKAEAAIDWASSAIEIDRKVRAFNPFPVVYCGLEAGSRGEKKRERLRIWAGAALGQEGSEPILLEAVSRTETESQVQNLPPGEIITADENGILVACGDGVYRIDEVQLPGRKRLPVSEILKSRAELFVAGVVLLSGE